MILWNTKGAEATLKGSSVESLVCVDGDNLVRFLVEDYLSSLENTVPPARDDSKSSTQGRG